jgi:uncharacterized protein (TIGR02246 family)
VRAQTPRHRDAARYAPEQLPSAFVGALNIGDLHLASACFARDACLITPDATAIRGRDGIRALLAQLVLLHAEIEIEHLSVLRAGDVALVRGRWTVRCEGAEGSIYRQRFEPTLVLQEVEGLWKLTIAAPWGN